MDAIQEMLSARAVYFDIETHVKGDRPSTNDEPVFVGFRSPGGERIMYHISERDQIQAVLDYARVFIGHNIRDYDFPIMEQAGFIMTSPGKNGKTYSKVIIDTLQIMAIRAKPMLYLDLSLAHLGLRSLCERFNLEHQKGDIDYDIFKQVSWTQEELAEIKTYLFGDLDSGWGLFVYLYEFFYGFRQYVDEKSQRLFHWLRSSAGAITYKIICNIAGIPEEYDESIDDTLKNGVLYEGAYVALPFIDRIQGNLYVVDWASLYPHMYMLGNLYSQVAPGTPGAWHGGEIFKPIEAGDEDGIQGWYTRTPGKIEIAQRRIYTDRVHHKNLRDTFEKGTPDYIREDAVQLATKIVSNTCFSVDTEILTVEGIKLVSDVKEGDMVYSINKITNSVEIKKVTGTISFEYHGDMIRFKSDQYDLLVTPDHDMVITSRSNQKIQTIKAWGISKSGFKFPPHRGVIGTPVDYESIEYSEWYLRGMYLADGHARNVIRNGVSNGFEVSFSKYKDVYPIVWGKIEQHLINIGSRFSYDSNRKGFHVYSKEYYNDIVDSCGRTAEKRIIEFPTTHTSRQALFDGLYDGDGSKGTVRQFSTKLIGLRDDFIRLATELGIKWQYRFDSGIHRVGLRSEFGTQTWLKSRNMSVEQYDGIVTCCEVEDNHTVLVGRNGKFEWSGQCYGISGSPRFKNVFNVITASDCTAMARMSIKHARKRIRDFGYIPLYTDSVLGDSVIVVRLDDIIHSIRFDEFEHWLKMHEVVYTVEKDFAKTRYEIDDDLFTPSMNANREEEWKRITQLIVHPTMKKCYTVNHIRGSVSTTGDHSLIDFNRISGENYKMVEVKPLDATRVIYSGSDHMPSVDSGDEFTTLLMEFLGFYVFRGKKEDNKVYIRTGKTNREKNLIMEKLIYPIIGYFDGRIDTMETRETSNMVCFRSVKLAALIHSMMGDEKHIPESLMNVDSWKFLAFLRGVFTAIGIKNKVSPMFQCSSERKLNDLARVMRRHCMLPSVGVMADGVVTLSVASWHSNWFIHNVGCIDAEKLVPLRGKRLKKYGQGKVTSVVELPIEMRKVYDIEVEDNHTFFANGVLVHNTDSVYLHDPYNDPKRLAEVCQLISKEQQEDANIYIDSHDLEIETAISQMYFFRNDKGQYVKKFYAYVKPGKKGPEVVLKGIKLVKGDCSKLALEVYDRYIKQDLLDYELCQYSPEQVFSWVKQLFLEQPDLLQKRYRPKNPASYKRGKNGEESTALIHSIAKRYGAGELMLIPNVAIGCGKDKHYAKQEELIEEFGDNWVDYVLVYPIVEELKVFIPWNQRGMIKKLQPKPELKMYHDGSRMIETRNPVVKRRCQSNGFRELQRKEFLTQRKNGVEAIEE